MALKHIALSAAAALAFGVVAAPASAVVPISCQTYPTPVAVGAITCAGFYDMNVFGGDADKIAQQQEAVAYLGGSFDGNWDAIPKVTSLNGNVIDFGQTLYGPTIVGAHFGNYPGTAQNVSIFWLFDFGTTGASGVTLLDTQGFSNGQLYMTNPIPEPAAWALMILGFGAVGSVLRHSKKTKLALTYA